MNILILIFFKLNHVNQKLKLYKFISRSSMSFYNYSNNGIFTLSPKDKKTN